MMNNKQTSKYLLLLVTLVWSQLLCAEDVGLVQYTRGAVTMQNMDGSSARLIAKNEKVQRGEVLKTGPRSFTIIKLNDGTRMTIRPNSSFSVEQFNPKKDSTATALLRLFRGGMRAITGYISKNNRDGYKVKTGAVTLGIRGTEFDVRLCKEDCEQENQKYKESYDKLIDRTVARSVFVRKGLIAKSIDGASRTLKAGSAIFEGDTLITKANAYAILVFRDKSRVSLQANTVFRVDEMKFDKNKAKESTALFSLLRGGLRTITGLIGKLNPRKYSMRTSVATIGIRGTGYDLMCAGSCAVVADNTIPPVNLPGGDGLSAYVWDGAIDFGGLELRKGSAAFIADKSTAPVVLPTVPDFFKENSVPKPDSFDVDETELFSKAGFDEKADPGVYISVTEGNVVAELRSGLKIDLHAGESAFADVLGRQGKQLTKIPAFQKFDVYPTPDVPNPAVIDLNANNIGDEDSGMTCEIK
ncbi:MAG: FecR domain-containing protein [Proteobacteria bacterium]|nr:FecR domain-containing protein [Pseudomonadota bacterium]